MAENNIYKVMSNSSTQHILNASDVNHHYHARHSAYENSNSSIVNESSASPQQATATFDTTLRHQVQQYPYTLVHTRNYHFG